MSVAGDEVQSPLTMKCHSTCPSPPPPRLPIRYDKYSGSIYLLAYTVVTLDTSHEERFELNSDAPSKA
jgi:hypothetical protein